MIQGVWGGRSRIWISSEFATPSPIVTISSFLARTHRAASAGDPDGFSDKLTASTNRLLDEAGNDISDTSLPGELSVRCPTVFKGYFQNPTASAASFTPDGFFLSGDIARRDLSTNKWYIVDRKKELIKVRGFQVAPAELEGVLVEHPDISDAAVIGVWVPQLETELPRAYVVRTKESLGEREVKKWVEERLAGFKRLEGGISFVDAIPKNATGKILKRILREKWDEETRKVAAKL